MLQSVWRAVASSAVAVLLLAGPVRAADAPRVRLEFEECDRLDATAVKRIFAADLGASVTSDETPDVTEVTIECDGARVIVRVRDPLSRKNLRRSFDSTSFGDRGESRLIAIAASELVLASWAELSQNPEPGVEPEGARPSKADVATARAAARARAQAQAKAKAQAQAAQGKPPAGASDPTDPFALDATGEPQVTRSGSQTMPDTRLRIAAMGSGRGFFNGDGFIMGGGARIGEDRPGVVSWAADLNIETGRIQGVEVTSPSAGGFLYAHAGRSWSVCRVGAGLRVGLLAIPGQTTVATWGWPLGTASCSLFGESVAVDLGVEIGYAVLQNQGPSKPPIRSGWMGASIGIGLVL